MVTKNQVENEYQLLIKILSDAASELSKIKGQNEQFANLKDFLVNLVENKILDSELEMENSMNHISWDNLVIAFFGETNAGKSTIIETFRILFDPDREKNQDGKIVGDGRQDFTRDYHEYQLSIEGQPFTLIDVPGIEGDEEEFKDIIKNALRKAHCVFYVQGHNKKPDAATAAKIKKYLGDWVNVYSIQNVRGAVTDYDEEEERKMLLTPNVLKNEKLIVESFKEILPGVYRGNIPVQALLAMCANATFAPERMDLQKTQVKLLSYFQSPNEVLRFSQFQTLVNIVAEKANNFTLEIAEANRQKMISLANKILDGIKLEVDEREIEYSEFETQLKQFRRDVVTDCAEAARAISNNIGALIDGKYNSLKNQIYGIIDDKTSKDNKKSAVESAAEQMRRNLSREIQTECEKIIENLTTKILQHRRKLEAFNFGNVGLSSYDVYPYVDKEDMGIAINELKINIGDVGDFLGAIAGGAAVGVFFGGPIGAGVGAGAAMLLHCARKLMFGDRGKGDAKEVVAESLRKSCEQAKKTAHRVSETIADDIKAYSVKASEQIDEELDSLEKLKDQAVNLKRQIANYENQIKRVVYGTI